MRLPTLLRGFLAASAFLTVFCLGSEVFCRFVLHWGNPYDYPLLRTYYMLVHRQILFVDFHVFFDKFHFFHSRRFYTESIQLSYPAPAVVAYEFFLIPAPTPGHGTLALLRYGAALVGSSLAFFWLWWKALVHRGLASRSATAFVAGAYLFSFALWFECKQGNIEWTIWILLSVAVWAFCTSRFRTAAILIGIAASMKFYPIIYLGLFIPLRRYREACLTVVVAGVSTVVGLWLVCPDIAYSWQQTNLGLSSFAHSYVGGVRAGEIGFDHSLFALVKLVAAWVLGASRAQASAGPYLVVVALEGILLFFTRIRNLPVPNQVLSLAVAAILLPPISYDYTLLHLYPGFVLLTFVALEHSVTQPPKMTHGLWAAFLLLAFVLSPESELIWRGVRYAGQIKAIALLALGYVVLRYPFALSGLNFQAGAERPNQGNHGSHSVPSAAHA